MRLIDLDRALQIIKYYEKFDIDICRLKASACIHDEIAQLPIIEIEPVNRNERSKYGDSKYLAYIVSKRTPCNPYFYLPKINYGVKMKRGDKNGSNQ